MELQIAAWCSNELQLQCFLRGQPLLSGQTSWPGEIFLAFQVLALPCYEKAFLDNVETYREAVAKELETLSERQFEVLTMKTFLKSSIFFLELKLYGLKQRPILHWISNVRPKPCGKAKWRQKS